MRRLIILNPQSRNGTAGHLFERQRDEWTRKLGKFDLYQTTAPRDATAKVRSVLESGDVDQIIIAGGDGSINEAFRGYWDGGKMTDSEVPLGIINFGTGGDFIRTVEASSDNYEEALIQNQCSKVDAALVTDMAGKDHPFLNIASVGMAGDMLRSLKSSKFQNGAAAYFFHTIKTLIAFDPKQAVIEFLDSEGQSHTREIDLINFFVCNGRFSGGGMQWAPHAELNDGLLQVALIGGRKKLPLILQSKKLYSGAIDTFPGAETFTAKQVVVKSGDSVSLETDGEIIDTESTAGGEIRFQVIEQAFPLVI